MDGSTFNAKVVPQLDGSPQQASNCGPATAARHVRFASRGKIKATPTEVRNRMGIPVGPTNIVDQKRAVESYADAFAAIGLDGPKMRKLSGVAPDVVRDLLLQGAEVSVQIGYHVINKKRPSASGQPTFNTPGQDGHSVAALGLYARNGDRIGPGSPSDGREFTDLIDPLDDGRRPEIAKGPQRIPLGLLFEAAAACPIDKMGNLLGEGRVLAGSVRLPKPIGFKPPPSPCDEVEQQRDEALAEVDRLSSKIRALVDAMDSDDLGTLLATLIGRASGDDVDESSASQPDADALSGFGTDTIGDIEPVDSDDEGAQSAALDSSFGVDDDPTKAELYDRARELGIEGRSKMDKAELAREIARNED
jgi:hypothetical protein